MVAPITSPFGFAGGALPSRFHILCVVTVVASSDVTFRGVANTGEGTANAPLSESSEDLLARFHETVSEIEALREANERLRKENTVLAEAPPGVLLEMSDGDSGSSTDDGEEGSLFKKVDDLKTRANLALSIVKAKQELATIQRLNVSHVETDTDLSSRGRCEFRTGEITRHMKLLEAECPSVISLTSSDASRNGPKSRKKRKRKELASCELRMSEVERHLAEAEKDCPRKTSGSLFEDQSAVSNSNAADNQASGELGATCAARVADVERFLQQINSVCPLSPDVKPLDSPFAVSTALSESASLRRAPSAASAFH
jgi:hypothetical protein|eukprot:TRINITY_DN43656_c0_g1_i1.p1 TRINITY_DN43656_c0_g1~~TRINITY_DN43656_c0_g1_i1.p1  ORF type:complete len:315 (-),score=44.69 TRINITY_DN43656_c0_g1_i1:124-1068(-)